MLDVRVLDTDAPSYCHRPVNSVIKSAEEDKKHKYLEAVEGRRGCFSLFVLSVDGYKARVVLKRIAETLSYKWNKSYSQVINWVRATISFSTFRATGLCLQGSRIKWRSSCGFDDGRHGAAKL